MRREFESGDGERVVVNATPIGDGRFRVVIERPGHPDVSHEVAAAALPDGALRMVIDGQRDRAALRVRVAGHASGGSHVRLPGRTVVLKPWRSRRGGDAEAGGDGSITAPMTGTLLSVAVAVGDPVEAGQAVAVLSAMKMEHKLTAPWAGTVAEVGAEAGATVQDGQLLVRIDAAEESD